VSAQITASAQATLPEPGYWTLVQLAAYMQTSRWTVRRRVAADPAFPVLSAFGAHGSRWSAWRRTCSARSRAEGERTRHADSCAFHRKCLPRKPRARAEARHEPPSVPWLTFPS